MYKLADIEIRTFPLHHKLHLYLLAVFILRAVIVFPKLFQ